MARSYAKVTVAVWSDPAAFGGVSSSVAEKHRARYTPEQIARLAGLEHERGWLQRTIAATENIEKEGTP